jgi:hypothetical protein
MSFTDKNMYELLPAFYRIRDAEQGEPLKALIEIIAREAKITEENIAQLYANWFIETCEEWVVPYIGDLMSVKGMHSITGSKAISQRAYVANTLSYRRRKGIAPVLEQLSLDAAGWRAHVTEFFELLATTQYMNHIRLHRRVTPDLRKMNQLNLLDTAFDTIAHTADVRHISSGRGKHNIPNIGLFVWKLQSYPITRSDARSTDCLLAPLLSPPLSPPPPPHYFTFSPLGLNLQLFNKPQTETSITHISEEINVPALLRRRILHDELDAARQAIVDGEIPVYNYFDESPVIDGDPSTKKHPVFEIYKKGSNVAVSPKEILICNIENCCTPPKNITYKKLKADGTGYDDVLMPVTVAVDPVKGRFIFTDPFVTEATVSYSYGFSDDTGGGPYNRQSSVTEFAGFLKSLNKEITKQVGVSKTLGEVGGVEIIGSEKIYKTLTEAITDWNSQDDGAVWVITIMDSHSYIEDIEITIKKNSQLLIIAADWPVREDPDNIVPDKRYTGDIAADGLRPHLLGNIKVKGTAPVENKSGGSFFVNGLLIEGKLSVLKGNLAELGLSHCTLVPAKGGLVVGAGIVPADKTSNQWLTINLNRCITGPVNLNNTAAVSLQAEDCIIDNKPGKAVNALNTPVVIKRTTVFGETYVKEISADNSIFRNIVIAQRRQTGCMRFCFAPLTGSATPRRFRCQPDLEINTQIEEAQEHGSVSNAIKNQIRDRVTKSLLPGFTSVIYGRHDYAQLHKNCPEQINTGADDGSEMGAFSSLKQPQRKANLLIALDEYLPLGLEAGIIYVT